MRHCTVVKLTNYIKYGVEIIIAAIEQQNLFELFQRKSSTLPILYRFLVYIINSLEFFYK